MYKISDKNSKGFFDALADNDNELIAAYIKDIYVEIFENTQALSGDDLDTFTAQVDVSSDLGDRGINREVRKLYRFCKENGIGFPLKENLMNEASDGWDTDLIYDLEGAEVLTKLQQLLYEIDKTYRGAYTHAKTYEALGQYVVDLAEGLEYFGQKLSELEDDDEDIDESLNERELSKLDRSISKIFVDNKDKINKAGSKEELILVVKDLLKDVNPERTEKIFSVLKSKKDYFNALKYIYDFILKGDGLGVIKEEVKINVPSVDKFVADAEAEADKLISKMGLEECELIDADEFVYDDVAYIDMFDDDDGVREPIKKEVNFTNECTPDRFKPDKEIDFNRDKAALECKDSGVDFMVDDDFEADDIDSIDIK